MLSSVKYWLWLTDLLEPSAAWAVFCHFGSPERAYFSDPEEYERIEGLSPQQRRLLHDKSTSAAEALMARCDSKNIRILTFSDTDFPERLRNIDVPPLVLYLRGRMVRFDERAVIAMAGTRRATPYGAKMATDFARDISKGGGVVATGIVTGCDENAVIGALLGGGPLVCVVAGGVDLPYYDTEANRILMEQITSIGCILSEAPVGTPHKGTYFRRRNTILCGLSVGLLCVEAGVRSGTLGVAELAMGQGKDIFAIPANLSAPMSAGTNELLRQGLASPVLSAKDILSRYSYLLPATPRQPDTTHFRVVHIPGKRQHRTRPQGAEQTPPKEKIAPSAPVKTADLPEKGVDTFTNSRYIELLDASDRWNQEEKALLKALIDRPATAESLIAATELNAGLVSATLTMLTVSGALEECSGGRFRLLRSALE